MAGPKTIKVRSSTNDGDAKKNLGRHASMLQVLGAVQAFVLVAFALAMRVQRRGVFALAETPTPPSAVHALTDATLDDFVAGLPEGALVNFYSPTCRHCQELEPEFEAAARDLAAKGGAPLASASVSAAPESMARYNVEHYPTMLWFRKGKPVLEVQPGARTAAKIAEFVEWAGQASVVPFETREELDEAVPEFRLALYAGAPPVIVGFDVAPSVYEALEAAAERSRGKTVFAFARGLREGDPALRAYFYDAAEDLDFEGDATPEAVHTWVSALVQRKRLSTAANSTEL